MTATEERQQQTSHLFSLLFHDIYPTLMMIALENTKTGQTNSCIGRSWSQELYTELSELLSGVGWAAGPGLTRPL